jgi:hypothetical protein
VLKYDLPWIGRLYSQRDTLREKLKQLEVELELRKKPQSECPVLHRNDVHMRQEGLQSIHDKLGYLVGIYPAHAGKEMEYLEKLVKVEPIRNDELPHGVSGREGRSAERVESGGSPPDPETVCSRTASQVLKERSFLESIFFRKSGSSLERAESLSTFFDTWMFHPRQQPRRWSRSLILRKNGQPPWVFSYWLTR